MPRFERQFSKPDNLQTFNIDEMTLISIFFSILLALLIIGTIVVIIFDNGDSSKKIAWLLIITILPIVGPLL